VIKYGKSLLYEKLILVGGITGENPQFINSIVDSENKSGKDKVTLLIDIVKVLYSNTQNKFIPSNN
jgi:hypothetical protein